MDNDVTSVFDIVGRIPITPTKAHIEAAFELGRALRSLLPTPITKVSFDLDEGIRQSSLTVELQTALVGGLAGLASLAENKNIYEYAYQEGIKVGFVPNSKALDRPDTTLLTVATVDYKLILALTTRRREDQLAVTAINEVPVSLVLDSDSWVWVLTSDAARLRQLAASGQLSMRVVTGQPVTADMALMVLAAADSASKLCEALRPLETVAGAVVFQAPR